MILAMQQLQEGYSFAYTIDFSRGLFEQGIRIVHLEKRPLIYSAIAIMVLNNFIPVLKFNFALRYHGHN
jgi:hypothetical protein